MTGVTIFDIFVTLGDFWPLRFHESGIFRDTWPHFTPLNGVFRGRCHIFAGFCVTWRSRMAYMSRFISFSWHLTLMNVPNVTILAVSVTSCQPWTSNSEQCRFQISSIRNKYKNAPGESPEAFMRCVAESNHCARFCRPLPNHSANAPLGLQMYEKIS